jgi:UDP-N-acetylglucosamine diphosphorylase/glucosamine-1-phosphate N-acetyltransferase
MASNSAPRPLATLILAAGKGTRMKNPGKAKVMYEICGRPMIDYVANLAGAIGSNRTIAVVGHERQSVTRFLRGSHPTIEYVTQEPQLGTGHAVMQAQEVLSNFSGDVLVLSGDVPLLTQQTVDGMLRLHASTDSIATILTAVLDEPGAYGRIIRKDDGSVKKIVEQRDASTDELKVNEINSGIYVFDRAKLFEALESVRPQNSQNEYYLTDVFASFSRHGLPVSAIPAEDPAEVLGINTVEQLHEAQRVMEGRLAIGRAGAVRS